MIFQFSCLFFQSIIVQIFTIRNRKFQNFFMYRKTPETLLFRGNLQLDTIVSYVLHSIFSKLLRKHDSSSHYFSVIFSIWESANFPIADSNSDCYNQNMGATITVGG